MRRVLVTGAFGQIGSELVPALEKQRGVERVVAVGHKNIPSDFSGILERTDVRDGKALVKIVKKHKIDTIFHLASLLSANGEAKPDLAWEVNLEGLKVVLDAAREYELRVFWPSSIAVFGPTTPRDKTPQQTVLEPTTMYGVTKVAGELLCQYYYLKYGVDVRSVRYPGLISWKAEPGGGTTDYAVAVFYEALKKGRYEFFVRKDTVLPMMYMDDAIEATIKLMKAPGARVKIRTSYNLAAMSFSAKELADEVAGRVVLRASYKPDKRQKIADSWPRSIDDRAARTDWGHKHYYDLKRMTEVMITKLGEKLGVGNG